uniref:Uncharacterized protein n=1 Tax=Cacopsylla melanoneura TaxID=428564 RepID=A0A8D9E8R6_9HEMI
MTFEIVVYFAEHSIVDDAVCNVTSTKNVTNSSRNERLDKQHTKQIFHRPLSDDHRYNHVRLCLALHVLDEKRSQQSHFEARTNHNEHGVVHEASCYEIGGCTHTHGVRESGRHKFVVHRPVTVMNVVVQGAAKIFLVTELIE